MPLRTAMLAFVLGVVAWIAMASRAATPPAEPLSDLIETRRFEYLEDEGSGRRLADIRVDLLRRGDEIALRIVASATGPRVDPIPGWQGVAGGNRITAEEIASILERGRLRVETDGDGVTRAGAVGAGRRGRLAERRRTPEGAIDHRASTDLEYPLELVATSAPLGRGTCRTRLVVDGKARLEVTTFRSSDRGRIVEVRTIHDDARLDH